MCLLSLFLLNIGEVRVMIVVKMSRLEIIVSSICGLVRKFWIFMKLMLNMFYLDFEVDYVVYDYDVYEYLGGFI